MRRIKALIVVAAVQLVSGCIDPTSIDTKFRRIDQAWAVEYQKTEDEYRYRIIQASLPETYVQVKRAFLNLGMPIMEESEQRGLIVAGAVAPTPLTKEEWKKVAQIEGPRVSEIGGWMFHVDAKGYFVTVSAKLAEFEGGTVVLINYRLDNAHIRSLGYQANEYAPPTAVQIGSLKFWNEIEKGLRRVNVGAPRKRRADEKKAVLF